ncbi:MAG: hypothetical protein Q7U38_04895 [Methylobacter sp.]|nr:hypothetical protein [Methylobacter sp.]MDP2098597.1 hypothetical protein [Methylobacter sp.]MDP2427256.1 hypothetical protein [Methylobacter sp.]MDP3054450.1 hypothetical protein [Methylobacter sp.]MDP3362824.1 hypothetical protein [Methylobacter sp.]
MSVLCISNSVSNLPPYVVPVYANDSSICTSTDLITEIPIIPVSDLANLKALLDTYFQFDADLFVYLTSATLVVFALGLSTGLIAKMLMGPKPD